MKKNNKTSDIPTNDIHMMILGELHETYEMKNHDYGDSFHNLYQKVGMPYAYGHMAEKLERVWSLMQDNNKVVGESMRDSLLDLANYAILTIMELDKNKTKEKEQ